MALASSARRNALEVLRRNWAYAYFGEDPTGIAQNVVCLNGEYVLGLNAAGTGTVNLIGVNALNQVVTGSGVVLPTAEHFTAAFSAATAVNQVVYIAATTLQVSSVQIVFGTASASGTFTIEHLTGTQASGAGTAMLTAPLSTAGAANTVLTGALVATTATLQLAAGDRIGVLFGGTETGLAGLNVTITLTRY